MPKRASEPEDAPDIFGLLDEIENGPPPCPHVIAVGKDGSGWAHERDPQSPYYKEWVHSRPTCRRSAFPGKHKQEFK